MQLKNYAGQLGAGDALAFVCASYNDFCSAEGFDPGPNVKYKALRWEEIYRILDNISETTPAQLELKEFMRNHGLAPAEPLFIDRIVAFRQAFGLIEQLKVFANKLHGEFAWQFGPVTGKINTLVTDRYGRVAIEFDVPNWKPVVSIGFLYDPKDHGVELNGPIDVMLRVEASPRTYRPGSEAFTVLKAKAATVRDSARSVTAACETKNRHTLLIVQRSLTDVLGTLRSEREQLEAIHAELNRWLVLLFDDGKLERALA